jgi:hypothetical protein
MANNASASNSSTLTVGSQSKAEYRSRIPEFSLEQAREPLARFCFAPVC